MSYNARLRLFNNGGQLFAVRQLTSAYNDRFIWKLLGKTPTFQEVWISETWLMRRAMSDVLLRSPEDYTARCRSCPIYVQFKNLWNPLRTIKKRLWRIKYKTIDDQRRKKAG
jgi:hypothetical protein